MKLSLVLLLAFLHLATPLSRTVFQTNEYFYEFRNRVDPKTIQVVQRLLDSREFDSLRESRTLLVLRELEDRGVLRSWHLSGDVFKAFVKNELIRKSEQRRYFFLRDAIRESGRSVVDSKKIDSVKGVLRTEFMAVLSDSQFRIILSPLLGSGFLKSFFQVVGDLVFFDQDEEFTAHWDRAFSNQKSQDLAINRVSTLMKLAQAYPGEYVSRARKVRDAGYFERYFLSENQKYIQTDLWQVFYEYFFERNLAANVQQMMKYNLLMPAIQKANKQSIRHLRESVLKMDGFKESQLHSFLASPGFKVFVDPNFTEKLIYLSKNKVIIQLLKILPHVQYLADPKFHEVDEKVRHFLLLEQKKKEKLRLISQKREKQKSLCYENMNKLMQKRGLYNLKYREEINLQSPKKRKRLFGLLPGKFIHCPSDGKYRSTEYGWVYCTRHGKALVPGYE